MNAIVSINPGDDLPTLLGRAGQRLLDARTSGEVLEARQIAQAALALAKVTQAANETHADCLRIITRAESRMADEVDAAQERGEVATPQATLRQGSVVRVSDNGTPATMSEIGIDRQRLSEWRTVRDAGDAVVEGAIQDALAEGRAPTRADINRAARQSAESRAARRASTPVVDGGDHDTLRQIIASGIKFGTIYADPPWSYTNQGTRAATSNHYDSMSVDELCALPIRELVADDAHLHLWTTNAFLFECPRIFEAWGFEFRSSYVWVKPQMGIGNYWRNSHEILLTAIRGDAKRFNVRNLKSWGEFPRTRHSAKPPEIRRYIEQASPGPFLGLFHRSLLPGWVVWGNEIKRDSVDDQLSAVRGGRAA